MKQQTSDNITAFLAGLALFALLFVATQQAGATGNNRDDIDIDVGQHQTQEQQQGQEQSQSNQADSTSTSSASNDGVTVGGDDLAISNVYMSRAFAQDFPITSGCFAGVNAGHDRTTASKSTGSFLGFTFLNTSCHLQGLAAQERDVVLVARLKCGDRKYRNAVAFDHRDYGQNKRERCIDLASKSMIGAIEEERERVKQLEKDIQAANSRAEAAEDLAELARSHKQVCEESKERCESELFSSK
jgi:hypothetical protein